MISRTLLIFLAIVSLTISLKYDVKAIQRDSTYTDKLDKSDMKLYSVDIDNQLEDKDLLIDSNMLGTSGIYETPLTLISLVFSNLI
jgi:hypothetical protein